MGEFLEFLKNYLQQSDSKDSDIINNCKDCVKQAEAGMLGKLGRVFNDFPLALNIIESDKNDMKREIPAVEAKIFTQWLNDSHDVIIKGKFELGTKDRNVWSEKEKKHIPKEVSDILVDDISKKKIHAIVQSIIFKACEELLNEKGQLRQEIIDLLGLKNIIQKYKMQPQKIKNITAQLIYSYCSQTVISHLTNLLQAKMQKELATKPDLLQNSIEKLNQFNVYVENLIFDKYDAKLSTFIQEVIQDYIDNIFLYAKPLYKRCADELKELSFSQINDLIQDDLELSFELNNNLSKQKLQAKNSNSIYLEKLKFWIDVMDFYRQEFEATKNANTLLLFQSVFMGLMQAANNPDFKLPLVIKSKFDKCAQVIEQIENQKNTTAAEFKEVKKSTSESKIDYLASAKQILLAVNNNFLIDHVIHIAIERKIISPYKNKDLLKIITGYKLDNDMMQKPSNELFNIMATIAENNDSPKFFNLLNQCKVILEDKSEFRTGLFGRARSVR